MYKYLRREKLPNQIFSSFHHKTRIKLIYYCFFLNKLSKRFGLILREIKLYRQPIYVDNPTVYKNNISYVVY